MTSTETMLKVEGVYKAYGRKPVLDNVSLSVPKGVHVLVLGPNGAGKTTLIKCIMNLVRFKGTVTVNGLNVRKRSKEAKMMIGYVPQSYALYDSLSIEEHARLTVRLKQVKKEEIDDKLGIVGLLSAKNKKVRELSSGMRQRLGIALALIGNPPFLILDEPTSNVDIRGRFELQKILDDLQSQGKTMLTTTHFAGLGEMAKDVVIMDHGKIVATGDSNALLSKISANSTIYLRFTPSTADKATQVIQNFGPIELRQEQGWLAVTLPSETRMDLVANLVKANCPPDDLILERLSIESEYLKLIEGGKAS